MIHLTGFERDTTLKSDIFSTIERGSWRGQAAIRRDASTARWWVLPLAHHFLRREKNALVKVRGLGIAPDLLDCGKNDLVRSWLDGLPMQMVRPQGRHDVFQSAMRVLKLCHRAGVAHNDLAKEPNWLIRADGQAYLTDFQLATCHRRRSRLFRVLAYEDLRHLLKHKRKYCPEALSPIEKKILARKSLFARIWMQSGKRVYRWITRGVMGVRDREGGGLRLARSGPVIERALKECTEVKDAAVVAFPYPRRGTGLYVFVVADKSSKEAVAQKLSDLPEEQQPDRVQLVSALPKDETGEIRRDLLTLIATNQIDLLESASGNHKELFTLVKSISEQRLNLSDRT